MEGKLQDAQRVVSEVLLFLEQYQKARTKLWLGLLGVRKFELDFTLSTRKYMLRYELVDVETMEIIRLINRESRLPFSSNGLRHPMELMFENVRARPLAIQAIFLN
ncbi:hypothetical protein Salat_2780800 [Sesamum alatum]|uniref:Uncharacterized protein n=1 Tax=Sesamum alatum TaxID=300844 RepID=A0AAE1XKL7_9LAMI|nr:hypothetical protein Salat_2780800 [Sesamum alatum]